MHSDPFRGLIRFRKLIDIATMKRMVNAFSGERVPNAFIDISRHGFGEFGARKLGRVMRQRLKRLFGRD